MQSAMEWIQDPRIYAELDLCSSRRAIDQGENLLLPGRNEHDQPWDLAILTELNRVSRGTLDALGLLILSAFLLTGNDFLGAFLGISALFRGHRTTLEGCGGAQSPGFGVI